MTPCKRGHLSERYKNGACKQCDRERVRAPRKRNISREKRGVYKRNHYARHSAKVLAWNRAYNHKKDWPMTDVEKLLCQYRYEDAQRQTIETGVQHHVDHIWPLAKGGPHLPWNLQVLTAAENILKSDKI